MAQNELAGGDRTNLILSKRFDVQGAPAPFMASEIFPNVVLENDRPEWEWLGLGRLCTAALFIAGAVGNNGVCGLINPAGSGVLAVVKRIVVLSQETSVMTGGIDCGSATTSGLTADKRGNFRDSRSGFASGRQSSVTCFDAISATVPSEARLDEFVLAANGDMWVSTVPYVLAPNSSIYASMDTQNIDCWTTWQWTERKAEQGELIGAFGQ